MDITLSFYQVLCLLGVPSLSAIIGYFYKRLKKNDEETKAIKEGLQALLRCQMINDYNRWDERGFAPIYARENFENVWKNYHSLGANGVMDGIHEKFMELPATKQNAKVNN